MARPLDAVLPTGRSWVKEGLKARCFGEIRQVGQSSARPFALRFPGPSVPHPLLDSGPCVFAVSLSERGLQMTKEDVTPRPTLNQFIHVIDVSPLDSETERIIADLDEGEKQAVGLASKYAWEYCLALG